jgi:hypothetical protein
MVKFITIRYRDLTSDGFDLLGHALEDFGLDVMLCEGNPPKKGPDAFLLVISDEPIPTSVKEDWEEMWEKAQIEGEDWCIERVVKIMKKEEPEFSKFMDARKKREEDLKLA